MPIYAYKCESCGHAKDVLQKMSDPLLTVCPSCGATTFQKQLTSAGFQLKGSGWYVTDFRGGDTAKAKDEGKAEPGAADGKPEGAASDKPGASVGDTAAASVAAAPTAAPVAGATKAAKASTGAAAGTPSSPSPAASSAVAKSAPPVAAKAP